MENRRQELKEAEKGSLVSLAAYLFISASKLLGGYFFSSAALMADGWNNLTDSINALGMLVGLRYAQKPADANHRYGHWRGETVATLAMSFMILFIGIQVVLDGLDKLGSGTPSNPQAASMGIAALSSLIMLAVYFYNSRLAKRVKSAGLQASAKDNLVDMLTSLATIAAVIISRLGIDWADPLMSLLVGLIIIKTGLEIFRESAFVLTDGFPESDLQEYKTQILQVKGVLDIATIRGRMYGNNPSLDVTILVDPKLSVGQAHDITEKIEDRLHQLYPMHSTDIHVEPLQKINL